MKKILFISIFILSNLLVSCNSVQEGTKDTILPISTETEMFEITSTLAPFVDPTAIPISTEIPSPTVIPKPTLTNNESYQLQKSLLNGFTNCHLPCWWGMTPGSSTWDDTEEFLQSTGLVIFDYENDTNSTLYSISGLQVSTYMGGVLDNHMDVLAKDEIVQGVFFSSYAVQSELDFQYLLRHYSPYEILKEYGVPSRILLASRSGGPAGSGRIAGYELWLFYDESGFF